YGRNVCGIREEAALVMKFNLSQCNVRGLLAPYLCRRQQGISFMDPSRYRHNFFGNNIGMELLIYIVGGQHGLVPEIDFERCEFRKPEVMKDRQVFRLIDKLFFRK